MRTIYVSAEVKIWVETLPWKQDYQDEYRI
jgi:hypothetical protein